MVIEVIFIIALGLIVYAYVGYPVVIYLLSRLSHRPINRADIAPRVSFIIAAHNEARDIAAKLENTLALDYPADKREIIVASDCSTDATEQIVERYATRGVRLFRQTEHLGKTVAQHQAVKQATGEILVFSDATTHYQSDALHQIVRSFADPTVGCVAGQLIYRNAEEMAAAPTPSADETSGVARGCRSYWGYEKFLKACESRLGSLIGVSGCLYAVRRSSFVQLRPEMIDDFVVASEIHLRGLRTVYEPSAVAVESTNKRGRDEFGMRVRVIQQTITALHHYRAVLNPWRHGLFAFQMLSHKVLRYAVAPLLLIALVTNVLLWDAGAFYQLTLLAQVAFYALAVMGWVGEHQKIKIGPLALPYYVMLANAAVLVATLEFLIGKSHVVWTPLREAGSTIQQARAEQR